MKITIGKIKEYISNTIYLRGRAYYENGRVKILEINDHSFTAEVRGTSRYLVSVEEVKNKWVLDCDCPYWDNCKHIAAALLKARDFYDSHAKVDLPVDSKNWRGFFYSILANRTNNFQIKPQKWTIGFVLKFARLTWDIECFRFFVKKDGSLGRSESIRHWLYDELYLNSADVFSALEYMLNRKGRSLLSNSYGYNLNSSFAYNEDVGELITLLRTCVVFVQHFHELHRLSFSELPCRIEWSYEEQENDFTLKPHVFFGQKECADLKRLVVLCRKPLYLLDGFEVYQVENLTDGELLTAFAHRKEPVPIPKTDLAEFLDKVFPLLAERTDLPLPNGAESVVIDRFSEKQILLVEEKQELKIFLRFLYGGHSIDFEDNRRVKMVVDGTNIITIRRDMDGEQQAAELLLQSRAKRLADGSWRVLESRALNWLFKQVPQFVEQGYTLLGREKLKKYSVRTGSPNVQVNISSELDWFDVHISVDIEGIELSLKELRRALRNQSPYVKLVDKSTALLPDDWFERFKHLFHFAQMDDERIRASRFHANTLAHLFDQADSVKSDEAFQSSVRQLEHFEGITAQELPTGLVGELRPYQKAGYDWLYFLQQYSFGGCLADDMGLGKTVQALALLQKEKENGVHAPSLIVCPTSVVFNWEQEIVKFVPGLRALIHTGQQRDRSSAAFDDIDIVLTTYGVMLRDYAFFQQTTFHYIILDESQKIKNPNSQTAHVSRLLRSTFRLSLTGTPVENNTLELWSQFAFLNPGMLSSLAYFRSAFANQIEKYQNAEASRLLQKMIFPFILRRTKEKVAKELPAKTEQTILCNLSTGQQAAYNEWRDFYRAKILKAIDEQGLDQSRMNLLAGLTKLRQIACHPQLVSKKEEVNSGKFETLFELVEEIVESGHKLLLFSQFVKMLDLIRPKFEELGIAYEYLDGSTENRQYHVENFQQNKDIKAFLISLRAGGTGLNLTAADYVIHYDPWWNPAVEMQATDRAHRIGQDKKVFVYKLISKGTVEEKILTLQERKLKLVTDLISTETSFFKSLDRNDIEVLLS